MFMRLGLFPVLSCQCGSAEMIDQNPDKEENFDLFRGNVKIICY